MERKPGENGNPEVNGWWDSRYIRDNRKLEEIVNRYWPPKLPWTGVTRRTLEEMCWGTVLNEKQVGRVQLETEGSTPLSRVEREYLMILEKKVKRPIRLQLTVS